MLFHVLNEFTITHSAHFYELTVQTMFDQTLSSLLSLENSGFSAPIFDDFDLNALSAPEWILNNHLSSLIFIHAYFYQQIMAHWTPPSTLLMHDTFVTTLTQYLN
jgi:hypothetical protein